MQWKVRSNPTCTVESLIITLDIVLTQILLLNLILFLLNKIVWSFTKLPNYSWEAHSAGRSSPQQPNLGLKQAYYSSL
jgi:hypothetical protein